jgi:mannose-6-phosphate isomerase-like protein (cupin superfamily)
MKRVITGERDGRSVFAHVDDVELAFSDGLGVGLYWGSDQIPFSLPIRADEGQPVEGFFPGPQGVRMTLCSFMPDSDPGEGGDDVGDLEGVVGEDGFHVTDTVDACWLISGELGLEIDGETIWLTPGDLVVQHGTHHAWRNRTSEPALLGCVTFGAARA